jgi:hypothetical protein
MQTLAESEPRYGIDKLSAGTEVSAWFAGVGFLLLFPGFMVYHYGISADWWGAALGGLFGGAALLIAACVLLEYRRLPKSLSALSLLVLGTLTYMVAWSLVSWTIIPSDSMTSLVMGEAAATVIIWIAMLYIGAYMPCNAQALWRLSGVSITITLLCFGHAFYTLGFPFGPSLAFVSFDEFVQSTYQGIGRSLVAIGLVAALATRSSATMSSGIMLGCFFLLLTLGSRAHAAVFFVSLSLHFGLLIALRQTRVIGISMLVVFGLMATSYTFVFIESRNSEILDLSYSVSWQQREWSADRALEVISDNPLVGQFGYHWWDSFGYAHNMLSAWTQYGLVGFIAFTATLVYGMYIALAGFTAARASSPAWSLALHFNLVAILLAIFSEPVMSSVFPALAWGFTLRAARVVQNNLSESS